MWPNEPVEPVWFSVVVTDWPWLFDYLNIDVKVKNQRKIIIQLQHVGMWQQSQEASMWLTLKRVINKTYWMILDDIIESTYHIYDWGASHGPFIGNSMLEIEWIRDGESEKPWESSHDSVWCLFSDHSKIPVILFFIILLVSKQSIQWANWSYCSSCTMTKTGN